MIAAIHDPAVVVVAVMVAVAVAVAVAAAVVTAVTLIVPRHNRAFATSGNVSERHWDGVGAVWG